LIVGCRRVSQRVSDVGERVAGLMAASTAGQSSCLSQRHWQYRRCAKTGKALTREGAPVSDGSRIWDRM